MTNEKAVAEKLLQVSAIKLNPNDPFTWASGWKSPIYCDNRKVLSFPYVRDFIKSEMCKYASTNKILVIEDLISTGKSSLQVVDVLRNAGLEVVGMVSIFNYGFQIAEDAFKAAGVPYISLTNYASLIELAVEKGLVDANTQSTLMEWRDSPSTWKQ